MEEIGKGKSFFKKILQRIFVKPRDFPNTSFLHKWSIAPVLAWILGGLLISPSAAQTKNVGCLTHLKISHSIPLKMRKVTAGWYGPRHHNNRTANGQKFNMHKNTLAHRTLPFGTRVRLVNLHNGKAAEGVVTDRGPYTRGRDLDVSYAMAKQLGFVRRGTATLYMEKICVSGEIGQTNEKEPI